MQSTVRKELFVVIYLQIDVFIKEDVRGRMCTLANQLAYVYPAGSWRKTLYILKPQIRVFVNGILMYFKGQYSFPKEVLKSS